MKLLALGYFYNILFQGLDVNDKDAFKKLEELEKTLKIERELKQRMSDRSARAFFKQFGKMVEECDVIIQVFYLHKLIPFFTVKVNDFTKSNYIFYHFSFDLGQVLDARDPNGTRCKEVETKVLDASKRILLVSDYKRMIRWTQKKAFIKK